LEEKSVQIYKHLLDATSKGQKNRSLMLLYPPKNYVIGKFVDRIQRSAGEHCQAHITDGIIVPQFLCPIDGTEAYFDAEIFL
jgi:hypothetical protein